MGVKGLLVALQNVQKPINISTYVGCRVGIDAYAWLHRGAYACAYDVVNGGDGSKAVRYCERRLMGLRNMGIEPVIVFDGQALPSKSSTNAERAENRQRAREKAETLIKAGKVGDGYKMMGQAISISEDMTENLMVLCKKKSFEFIVAPYEADAELGYLSSIGYVEAVISEDSDLLLYGCQNVLFKLDESGSCLSITADSLPTAELLPAHLFTHDALILLCALSGCDYIPSIKGIGLKKGAKFIAKHVCAGHGDRPHTQSWHSPRPNSENLPPYGEHIKDSPKVPPGGADSRKASATICSTSPDLPWEDGPTSGCEDILALGKLCDDLRANGYEVPENYPQELLRALFTFKHQPAWNPITKSLQRRHPLPSQNQAITPDIITAIGPMFSNDLALQLCTGKASVRDPSRTTKVAGVQTPPRPAKPNTIFGAPPPKPVIKGSKHIKSWQRRDANELQSSKSLPAASSKENEPKANSDAPRKTFQVSARKRRRGTLSLGQVEVPGSELGVCPIPSPDDNGDTSMLSRSTTSSLPTDDGFPNTKNEDSVKPRIKAGLQPQTKHSDPCSLRSGVTSRHLLGASLADAGGRRGSEKPASALNPFAMKLGGEFTLNPFPPQCGRNPKKAKWSENGSNNYDVEELDHWRA